MFQRRSTSCSSSVVGGLMGTWRRSCACLRPFLINHGHRCWPQFSIFLWRRSFSLTLTLQLWGTATLLLIPFPRTLQFVYVDTLHDSTYAEATRGFARPYSKVFSASSNGVLYDCDNIDVDQCCQPFSDTTTSFWCSYCACKTPAAAVRDYLRSRLLGSHSSYGALKCPEY